MTKLEEKLTTALRNLVAVTPEAVNFYVMAPKPVAERLLAAIDRANDDT